MKIKKITYFSILTISLTIAGTILNINATGEKVNSSQNDGPEQNQYYTVIDENGNVVFKEYDEDIPKTINSNNYVIVKSDSEDSYAINTYDTYEEAEKNINKYRMYRTKAEYEIETIADTKDISYGVARIIGYTSYKEYDGSKNPRNGYTHGTSANDAAYISTSSDKKTIRVKQAGVIMDIPADNVSVSEYNSNSKVSYYMGKNGKFYHYYYSGSYNSTPTLYSNQVGYTPDYLKDGTKYYSYDGHYFYNSYTKLIDDYRTGIDYYAHAINATKPYYNYYQYLSFRSSTHFSASDMNKLITDKKGNNTESKLKNQGQALLNNQNTYGINASLMLGVSINESAWGLSSYSQDRNNLFGIGAVDSNPDAALRFESVEKCFNYFAYNTISCGYLNGSNYRYRGPHLGDKRSGINVKYASDPYWGEKAAAFSYLLNDNAGGKDYQKYTLAISKEGSLNFYQEANTNKIVYDSTAADSGNDDVYNFPVTILSTSGNYYKILSDTVLNSSRTAKNANGYFNINNDYVYVKTSDVYLRGTTISSSYMRGDVTGDGQIESDDYMQIKLYVLGRKKLSNDELIRADVNGDGEIDASDYMLVKLHVLGRQTLN